VQRKGTRSSPRNASATLGGHPSALSTTSQPEECQRKSFRKLLPMMVGAARERWKSSNFWLTAHMATSNFRIFA